VQIRSGAVPPLPHRVAVYSIATENVAAVIGDLDKRMRDGRIEPGPVNLKTIASFVYKRAKEWTSKSLVSMGNDYLQMVFADPVPERQQEFAQWYDDTHSRELLAVPGIMRIERSIKYDACPTVCSQSPKSLSALRIRASSIDEFKVGLERVAKTFTDTTSYDIANAWRLTLQRLD
jgi:hypothetical protein